MSKKKARKMSVKEINKKIRQIQLHLVPEMMDYIDFLIYKDDKSSGKKTTFKFNWQGGLSEISSSNTSVELQHKAMDWR